MQTITDKLTHIKISIIQPWIAKVIDYCSDERSYHIFPSKLKSITPDSANIPAIAAKTNGVEILNVEFKIG